MIISIIKWITFLLPKSGYGELHISFLEHYAALYSYVVQADQFSQIPSYWYSLGYRT